MMTIRKLLPDCWTKIKIDIDRGFQWAVISFDKSPLTNVLTCSFRFNAGLKFKVGPFFHQALTTYQLLVLFRWPPFMKMSWRQGGRWGVGYCPQFLANQWTLFQPCGTDCAHHIITGPSRFLNGVASLNYAFVLTFELMPFLRLQSKT